MKTVTDDQPTEKSGTKEYRGKWRNAKSEQKYRQLDAEYWQRLTTSPPTAIDVATSFGSTRAYRWEGSGPAVVFLHGMGDTSVRWIPFAEQMADFDVYAIDTMGDVGLSKQDVGFTSAADYGVWLGETVAGLELDRPTIVGHSMGGYLALSFATQRPDEMSATVAFDPVGVVDLKLVRFMAWGFGAGLASYTPGPIRRMLARRLRFPLVNDKSGMRLFIQGQQNHPPKLPPLPVFTDEELASISGPLTVLVGAKSSVFDIKKLVERIKTNVANGEARAVPEAGHALTTTHFEECLAAVRAAAKV